MPTHNKNKLSLIWDKRQNDFVVKYPRKADGHLLLHKIIGDTLRWVIPSEAKEKKKPYPFNFETENLKEELEKRGYDLTTLKFSIELKS